MSFFQADGVAYQVSAPGPGAITLSTVAAGSLSLTDVSCPSGSVIPYRIQDTATARLTEIGYATVTLSGGTWTLTRTAAVPSGPGVPGITNGENGPGNLVNFA